MHALRIIALDLCAFVAGAILPAIFYSDTLLSSPTSIGLSLLLIALLFYFGRMLVIAETVFMRVLLMLFLGFLSPAAIVFVTMLSLTILWGLFMA